MISENFGFRLLFFLASMPISSLMLLGLAERPYTISIEGCESGSITPELVQLLGGEFRPIAGWAAEELCSFRGNLMEDHADTFHVHGPAGEYRVRMGQDDGPINYIDARLTLPAGQNGATFTLALQEHLWEPDAAPCTTGIRVYRMQDFCRAYPRREYFPDTPQASLTPQAAADGNRLAPVCLPFGIYVIEERRTPRDADQSPCTHYYLEVAPR